MPRTPCFRTVIAGLDGAAGGADAFCLARRLAPDAERLVLVRVDPSDPLGAEVADGAIGSDAGRQAEEFSARAKDEDVEVLSRVVCAASVADGLAAEARRWAADLVVVGPSRRGLLARILLGDDTRAVLRLAPCAVAVAPHGYAARPEAPIAAIGVGYGTDSASQRAVVLARRLQPPGGTLHLMQVAHVGQAGIDAMAAGLLCSAEAAEAAERLQQVEGLDERTVAFGSVRDGLLELAARVDLLVVGRHHRSALGRLLWPGTAEGVLRALPCALLTVPDAHMSPDVTAPPSSPRDGSISV